MYFFLASFPGAKFYIREMSGAIGRAGNAAKVFDFSENLCEEIRFWEFLNSWRGHIPWRSEGHVALTVSIFSVMVLINALASKAVLLAPMGDEEALLVPLAHGFEFETLRHELWAFRVDRY